MSLSLYCYRTSGRIPADLATLTLGLRAGALRLGQRVGQVCQTAGQSVTSDPEALKAHRSAAAKANPLILEAAGLSPLLAVWRQAGTMTGADAASLFARTMSEAGPQEIKAPIPVVVAPSAKPAKPAKPVKSGPPTLAAVMAAQSEAPGAPVPVVAKPAKPTKAAPVAAATVPVFGGPVILDGTTIGRLAAMADAANAVGGPVFATVDGVSYQVNP